jgi:release factor glutamine methyltransferase
LAQARNRLASALAGAGKEPAALEARLLLEGASGLNSLELLTRAEQRLGRENARRLEMFLGRRLAGEPLGRILGRSGFYGLDLLVTPDVLDPRGDTETLVKAALEFVGARKTARPNVLDLGTGSGAILCALLDSMPDAFGIGVDLSLAASRIASVNLDHCGLSGRSAVICGNWADALAGTFDLIVSNPPYIALAERTALETEVADYDPALALYGGSDGLECYRQIAPRLADLLAPGGGAFFEIGWTQAASVAAIFASEGLPGARVVQDNCGRDRVVFVSNSKG